MKQKDRTVLMPRQFSSSGMALLALDYSYLVAIVLQKHKPGNANGIFYKETS
jgi:hypothetical protein